MFLSGNAFKRAIFVKYRSRIRIGNTLTYLLWLTNHKRIKGRYGYHAYGFRFPVSRQRPMAAFDMDDFFATHCIWQQHPL